MKFPKIFVINLDEAVKRWTKISQRAKELGICINRFRAIDGKNIIDVPKSHYYFTNYHVACCLSHRKLWEQAPVCVLEDDAIILKQLFTFDAPDDFDMMFLTNRVWANEKHQVIGGCGTEGYIVSQKGVEKLLKITEDIDVPIDLRIITHIETIINPDILWRSKKYPDITLKAYRTTDAYIDHISADAEECSYINRK